jgi:N-methylhydantoinase B
MVPGSMSTNAHEIFQEGLRVPAVKLIDKGVANQAVIDIMTVNSRSNWSRNTARTPSSRR